jgi:hypothetical protein
MGTHLGVSGRLQAFQKDLNSVIDNDNVSYANIRAWHHELNVFRICVSQAALSLYC